MKKKRGDDNPELSKDFFRRAKPARDVLPKLVGKSAAEKVLLPRGRPKKEQPKISTTLRLDADVLSAYRATGRGWQSRINDILKKHSQRYFTE